MIAQTVLSELPEKYWLSLWTPGRLGATDLQGHSGAMPRARQCRQITKNSSEEVLDAVQITDMTNAFQIWPGSSSKPSFPTERHQPLHSELSLTHHFLPTSLLQELNHWLLLLSRQMVMWGLGTDKMIRFLCPKSVCYRLGLLLSRQTTSEALMVS